MSEAWYSIELYPGAPRHVPCSVCGTLSPVSAVQELHFPACGYQCLVTCPNCGSREVPVQEQSPAGPCH